jgi:hypothetical protein
VGTVTFKITAKAGTNINAQNVTETPNTFDKTKALAFNPPMNRVESVYVVNAGSSVTFGGNTFNVFRAVTPLSTLTSTIPPALKPAIWPRLTSTRAGLPARFFSRFPALRRSM